MWSNNPLFQRELYDQNVIVYIFLYKYIFMYVEETLFHGSLSDDRLSENDFY